MGSPMAAAAAAAAAAASPRPAVKVRAAEGGPRPETALRAEGRVRERRGKPRRSCRPLHLPGEGPDPLHRTLQRPPRRRRGRRLLAAEATRSGRCHRATCCPRSSAGSQRRCRRSAASGSAPSSSLPGPNFRVNLPRPGRGSPPPGAACSHAGDAAPAVPAPRWPPPPRRSALPPWPRLGLARLGVRRRGAESSVRGSAHLLLYPGLWDVQRKEGKENPPQGQEG